MGFPKNLKRHISNIPGWRTNRKIIVIESDDWGSTRFPSVDTVNRFKKKGYNIDLCGFSRYDCLESNDDLKNLFKILSSHKDSKGNHPLMTFLCLTANPDFEKIKDSNFTYYYSKSIVDSLREYPNHDCVIQLYKEGIEKRIIMPQLHGKEHLYVNRWMRDLQNSEPDTLFAFDEGVSGVSPVYMPHIRNGYRAAFDLDIIDDLQDQVKILDSAVNDFEEVYGIRPKYFVAPDGPFNRSLEAVLAKNGIMYIGTAKIQNEPQGDGRLKKHFHWLGKRNNNGQLYITRNVVFEPISSLYNDWVDKAMRDIRIAFTWNKPAIISTHRANYTGTISESNREEGLRKLNDLLRSILSRWNDVEFLSSDQLGDLINESHTK